VINWQEQAAKAQQAIAKGIQAIFPYEGKINRLEASKIWVDQIADASTDYAKQKAVKGAGRTLSAPVYGSFRLVNKATGKVIDRTAKIKVTSIPIPTTRSSYIVNGSEYQVPNQLRLRPGVYTRVGNDGDLQAHVNLARGGGGEGGLKIYLNPKNWIFYLRRGTTNIMLYHVLIALGVSRQQLEKAWGEEVVKVNSAKSSQSTEIKKMHKAFIQGDVPAEEAQIIAEIVKFLSGTEISEETTKTTLGKSFKSFSPDLILRTTEKLLGILRGKEKVDDRDSLEFKEVLSVEDFLGERISKKAHIIKGKLRNNIDRQTEIRRILVPGIFSQHIDSFFTSGETGLSSTPEQTNPIHMVQEADKAVLTGMGGITNEHAITTEARAVHPSSLGFVDPVNTPESSRIGTTLHLPLGVEKKGRTLQTTVYEIKTGKTIKITAQQASGAVISFRDQYEAKGSKLKAKSAKVKASTGGTIKMVPASRVKYVFPTSQATFDVSTNMLPFLPSNQGNRAMMAAKQLSQALPLVNRESPHVQVVSEAGRTFESAVGRGFSHKSPTNGTVSRVTDDAMYVKDAGGKSHKVPIYKNFPLNSKTGFIDAEHKVKTGDKVRKGQLMADTNFTKGGDLALGVNAKVAYIPHKGWNFEDGVTISESFADKATSLHMYKLHADIDKDTVMDLKRFRAYYPEAVDLAKATKLDDTGVVKKGQNVRYGDTVLAVLRREATSPEDVILSRIHKAFVKPFKNRSVTWDEEDEGEVVEVIRTPKKIEVHIRTNEKVKIGDKFSSRSANKGTVTAIIPDAEMPHTKDGGPIDLALNPTSIPSRINPSQILETAAGKVAEKTGKKFVVRNFSGEDYLDSVEKAAKKAGVSDKEDLYDPGSGKTIPGVNVGSQYMLKLDHPTRKKFSARAQGPGYTSELQPTRGKASGGQALDQLTLYSMLAHGAKHNLREMATYKAEKNDEAWRALQTGQALPAPRTTFAFEKFTDMLRGSGVNVTKNGNELALGPMTDKQVTEMTKGEIKNSMVVRGKDLKPEKGGLFDQGLTGGIQGENWNHIQLAEPMPNPVFETAIKSLLDMRQNMFDDIVGGRRWVDKQGKMHIKAGPGRVTGGAGIQMLLGKVDMKALAEKLELTAKKKKGADLDKINKKLRYIKALQKNNLKPTDYVVTKVPVIPAKLRPVYGLADGSLDVTEVNHLYRDLIEVNNHQKDFNKMGLPDEDKARLRENTYKGMKAVAGLHPSIDGRNRRGLIEQIKGPRNKEGFFQNRIMSRRQEFTGRSTVTPDPELGLDEISVPEDMAWKNYQPFVVRELVRQGYSPLDAREQMEKKTPLAKRALQVAMENRPVIINRAPSLHKFNALSFKPQLTKGKAIKVNPLIVKGYNMDFDGDTASVHVPITEDARQESFGLLPSNNLWGPRQGELMHHPSLEAVAGLYMHTVTKKGRDEINALLPKGFKISKPMTEKSMMKVLSEIGRKNKPEFVRVVNKLKSIGNRESFQRGLTIGLEDLKMDQKAKSRILGEADKEAKKGGNTDKAIVNAYMKASKKLDNLIATDPKLKANGFRIMMDSGAKGNGSQIRQILAAPMLVQDISGRTVPVPIKKAYAQGLDMGDYWASMSGARKGMIDRALQTAEPGALAKSILNSTVSEVVGKPDCGTLKGVDTLVTDPEIADRFLARNLAGVGRRNELVTHQMLRKAKRKRLKMLPVRSPMTCRLSQGVCQKCYGIDEKGRAPEIGTNVGVIAGQAISERATQLTMRTFHTGSAAGSGSGGVTAGFQRVKELMEMPKKLRNQATLARVAGRITAVRNSPIGGWDVFIGTDKHHVPKSRALLVKRGDTVKQGQSISDGAVSPQELLQLRGMRHTQDYLVDQVVKEYGGQGINIKRKLVETAIRPLTNRVVVTDTGGHPTLVTGDNTTSGMVEDWNEKQLNPNKQIKFDPMLRGINTRPLVGQDWLSRLNFQKLQDTIQEGAGQGWKSDIASPFAPLASYAYGPTVGYEKF